MWGVLTARPKQSAGASIGSNWREVCIQGAVLAIAIAVAAVWVYTKPIVFTHDTFTYIHHARELQLRTTLPGAIFSRTPGFPLILLAFRITDLTHSVFWLITFHALLAAAMCWLFYLAARLVEPRGALLVSLMFIASLLPFINIKHIMTEQTFLFATMLALYGLIAYLMAQTKRDTQWAIVALGLGAAIMTLTRPQGAYVVLVLFGVAALLAWRRAKIALLAAVVVYAAIWSIQTVDQRIRSDAQSTPGDLDNSHLTGKMLLFSLYLDGARANIHFRPENGPKTAKLRALLLDELAKPDTLARRSGYMKSVPADQVPAFVEASFAEPNSEFFNMLAFTALNERLGPREADRLLVQVCLEAALAHPRETLWLIFDKAFSIYFNPLMLATPHHGQFGPGYFYPPLSDEIAAAGDYTYPTPTDFTIDNNLRWLMRIAALLSIITLPIALRYATWRITVALLLFGLYLNFAVIMGNTALFRYAIYAIPVNLLCAYVGTVACILALRHRYLRKSAVAAS